MSTERKRAERNLRTLATNGIRSGLGVVQAYPQDLVDILAELDTTRRQREEFAAAAVSALEQANPAKAAVSARARGGVL